MRSAGLVAAVEVLLPPETLRWQKHREQFVLTHSRVVEMTSTNVPMQFTEDQRHFDAVFVDKALNLPELDAGLLFVLLGSNRCSTIIIFGNPDEHIVVVRHAAFNQKPGLERSLFSRLCAFGSLPLSEQFIHVCVMFLFCVVSLSELFGVFQLKSIQSPHLNILVKRFEQKRGTGLVKCPRFP